MAASPVQQHQQRKVRVAHATPACLTLELAQVDVALFNTIRHALMSDVRTFAVDTVTFLQYDGRLEAETIAHRLGQLPIRHDASNGLLAAASAAGEAVFEIDVITDQTVPRLTWITSADVRHVSGAAAVVHYRDDAERALAVHDSGFMLAPLQAGERLRVRLNAVEADGHKGTRWSTVHLTCKPSVPKSDLVVRPDGKEEEEPQEDALADDPDLPDILDYTLVIETTGAVQPDNAWTQALVALETRLVALVAACE